MTVYFSERCLRVLVVDDHPMLREGITGAISRQSDLVVVAEAAEGEEAVSAYRETKPDIVLMDLQMPGVDGLEAIKRIRAIDPCAKILVLTTYSGDVRALRALKAGATGYLLKSAVRNDLIDAIRQAHRGERTLPVEVATEIATHAIGTAPSRREVEVLRCLATGHSNKQIAFKLAISEDTVKSHLKSLFAKLGTADRTGAVTTAAKRGIIDL